MLGLADYGAFVAGNSVLSAARSLACAPGTVVDAGPGPDSRLKAARAGAHA
jgi:hypothetical protein